MSTTNGKNYYAHLLQHPNWQKKRLEILQRDSFKCTHCTDTETSLHVHHKTYIKWNKPREYENNNFETVCGVCHEIEHLPKTGLETVLIKILWLSDKKIGMESEKTISTRDFIHNQLKSRV